MREGADLKLIALLYRKKIWISLLCALLGGILAGGLYFVTHVLYGPAREYEAVSKLYLTFAKDDDGDAYQYYNGYTWNDLMRTEPILDKAVDELLAETDTDVDAEAFRQEVGEAVTADILSDIRLLTVTVRTESAAKTDRIIRAAENALIRFGAEMEEFEKIEVIEHGQAALVVVEDETVRAAIAGAVIGLLASLVGLLLVRILDDSVYVPSDFEKRYRYPVLGVTFAGKEEAGREALEAHMDLVGQKKQRIVSVDTGGTEIHIPKEALAEDAGLVLHVPYGAGNGKLLERWIREAELLEAGIVGAVITEADPGLYRLYFAGFDKKKRRGGR